MFRTRKKAQEAKGKLRRLLSEQLENRQLMASDMMQWAPIPSHLIATPSSTHGVSGAILSTQFGGHARTTMFNNTGSSMDLGQPILVGRVDLSQMSPTSVFAHRGPVSPFSSGPVVEGRIEVSKLDPSNLPKDGSFGKATEITMGDAETIEFGEAILVGKVELSDLTPVTEVAVGDAYQVEFGEAFLVGEVDLADLTPVTEVAVGDAETIEFGEAILVGEVDLADLTPVSEGLSGKVTPASPLSSGPVVEGRIEVSKLDPSNLPKDGSFGKATEVTMGDAETIEFGEAILVGEVDLADLTPVTEVADGDTYQVEFGEAILVGEVELADLTPVTEVAVGDAYQVEFGEAILVGEVDLADLTPVTEGLSGKVTPASPLSSGPVVEGRIEVSKLDPSNLPKDGSFGKATEIKTGDAETIDFGEAILVGEVDLADLTPVSEVADGDTYQFEFGEAILVGEVELADLTPVTEGLSGKVTPASPLSGGPVVEGRIEVSKLDPNNLPKDGSVGKATEIKTGDAETIEFGEAILVGEVDLADLTPVTEVAAGDAYLIEFGEAILVGEVDLADLMPVSEGLSGKVTPASPLSSGPVVEGRIEVSKLDPSNLPKDGSFGKATVISPSKELPSSTEKKTFVSSATWNGESVQRKRSSGSLRNQLVDSALIDLFQL